MAHFIEIFYEEETKKYLRSISTNPQQYFPHTTFMRPFNPIKSEEEIIETIQGYCKMLDPSPLIMEGGKSSLKE